MKGQVQKVDSNVETGIKFSRGRGQQLPKHVRNFFESRFNQDFSHVNIHKETQAANAAKTLNSRAFTIGKDIFFGAGQFSPSSTAGQNLLAHELTHVLQQTPSKGSIIQRRESSQASYEKSAVYPPIYWAIDRATRKTFVIPKAGVSLQDIARYIYGTASAATDLAAVNELASQTTLIDGHPLRLTGKQVTKTALQNLKSSVKVPLGITDPIAFQRNKRLKDRKLERDFKYIIRKLDEIHYSDSDEGDVLEIFKKWGKEKFTTRPDLYPDGGEYLDKLFIKLIRKSKDIGAISTQKMSYYSIIFNKFDRVNEVRKIRDQFSKRFKGEEGTKEVKFTEEFRSGEWKKTTKKFWGSQFKRLGKKLKEIGTPTIIQNLLGGLVGVVQGFGEILYELGEGIWTLGKAIYYVQGTILYFITGAIEGAGISFLKKIPLVGKIFDPKTYRTKYEKTTEFMKGIGDALKDPSKIWKGIKEAASRAWKEVLDEYNKADDFNKSRIIAKGVVKVGMAVGGFIKSLPQLAKSTAKIARTVAKVAVIASKTIARRIIGAIKTIKGIIKGAWRVVNETLKNGQKRLRYFFKKSGVKKEVEIPAHEAKKYIKCSECKITDYQKKILSDSEPSRKGKGAKDESDQPSIEITHTKYSPAGEVKTRKPRGFKSTSEGTKKRIKAGTLENLEPTAYKPAPKRRHKSVTREQQLQGIEPKSSSKAAREEFEKIRDREKYAEKLDVGAGGQVHHAKELQVLDRYPGVFSSDELNNIKNMRGIPVEQGGLRQLHNSKIREIWDRHYKIIDEKIAERGLKPGTETYNKLVREHIADGVKEIDYVLGQFFSEYRRTLF